MTPTTALSSAAVLASTIGRKFTLSDLNPTLTEAAVTYARQYTGTFDYMRDMRATSVRKPLSAPQLVGVLNCLRAETLRAPKATVAPAEAPKRIAVEEAGVYVLPDGTVCKVKSNREKTRTYAMRWTDCTGERLVEDGDHRHGEYRYEAGLVQRVAAEGKKMTLEEAKHWSVLYGQCIRCGRTLKAAESVERGIGPVCLAWFSGH